MADSFDEVFANLRRGPWADDPNSIPQQRSAGDGQMESTGWLATGSVTADVIQANAITTAKIAAGAVDTDQLAAVSINASKIAGNAIEGNHIKANVIEASHIAADTITGNKIASNTITADEIAANTITASEIAANAITASEIAADAVTTSKILAANVTSSRIELTVTGKNFGANSGSAGSPGIFFDAESNSGMFKASGLSGPQIVAAGSLAMYFGGLFNSSDNDLIPENDNTFSLGSSGNRWVDVWAVDGTINTSDARLKRDIADAPLGLEFVKALRPRVYRWRDTADTQKREQIDERAMAVECLPFVREIERIRRSQLAGEISDGEAAGVVDTARKAIAEIQQRRLGPARESRMARRPGRRYHYGFIAQEVKEALDFVGVDADSVAFWKVASDGRQALSYTELIAPLLRAVQELADRVEELERGRA